MDGMKKSVTRKQKKFNLKNFLGNITTYITIAVASIAVVQSTFDKVPDSVFKAVVITLLGLLSIDGLLSTKGHLEQIDSSIYELSEQFQKIKIQKFNSADEAIEYLAKRTKEAKTSIDQASIDKLRAKNGSSARQQYEKARKSLILADRITYRYIGIVDIKRRMNSMKQLMENKDLTKLFVGCVLNVPDKFPMMSFVVFDKQELFIRIPYDYGEEANYMTIEGKEVVDLFLGYFEKTWNSCIKVKNIEQLNNVLSSLKQNNYKNI